MIFFLSKYKADEEMLHKIRGKCAWCVFWEEEMMEWFCHVVKVDIIILDE